MTVASTLQETGTTAVNVIISTTSTITQTKTDAVTEMTTIFVTTSLTSTVDEVSHAKGTFDLRDG